jgi:hypothetical protein
MTVLPDIAKALLEDVFPLFRVLGPTLSVYRTTLATPSADATTVLQDEDASLSVLRNTGSKMQQTAAGEGIWASDWIVGGPLGVDLQGGDIVTDGTRAFLITAAPETDRGLLLAPAKPVAVPEVDEEEEP